MVPTASTSTSLKDYLKKYESNTEEEKKKKKKKKKPKTVATGVLVVDEDPVWQKPVKLDEEEEDSPDEKPLVDEDIEVKRMKRLEQIRARRSYNQISEDGSGWVSVSSDAPKHSISADPSSDLSPPRDRIARYDTPSPEASAREDLDLSPPRHSRRRNDSPSPEPVPNRLGSGGQDADLSPPRQRRRRNDSPSPEHNIKATSSSRHEDLSPPRRRGRTGSSPAIPRKNPTVSSEKESDFGDLSPPRKRKDQRMEADLSPPRKRKEQQRETDISPPRKRKEQQRETDLSPPRKRKEQQRETDLSPPRKRKEQQRETDLSPPRKRKEQQRETDLSPPRKRKEQQTETDLSPPRKRKEQQVVADLSPPRKKEQRKTGLITGKDVREEITKTKKDEWSRFSEMDPSASGRGAEPTYRIRGERVSKEEYLKLTKKEEKPKEEKKLEWGKGLAQKREAEARFEELELEKNKPFARSRDDPELDRMLKDRLRWGDPMAHLVKKKQHDLVLPNLGEDAKMKESGFIVPQEIPSHSWLKRGLDFEPNRYGIKPGRHWDGVNRSNGYEKQLFKRMNEKRATEKEAYQWSVADM